MKMKTSLVTDDLAEEVARIARKAASEAEAIALVGDLLRHNIIIMTSAKSGQVWNVSSDGGQESITEVEAA